MTDKEPSKTSYDQTTKSCRTYTNRFGDFDFFSMTQLPITSINNSYISAPTKYKYISGIMTAYINLKYEAVSNVLLISVL